MIVIHSRKRKRLTNPKGHCMSTVLYFGVGKGSYKYIKTTLGGQSISVFRSRPIVIILQATGLVVRFDYLISTYYQSIIKRIIIMSATEKYKHRSIPFSFTVDRARLNYDFMLLRWRIGT